MGRRILWFLLIVFITIQFIRPARNNGEAMSANDITHRVHTPDTVLGILKRACFDCHSNHTDYPWYTNINPVGWWMNGHIKDGKRGINFSDLSSFNNKKLDHRLEDVAELTANHAMPLKSYTWIHTDAKLSDEEIHSIKAWTDAARQEIAAKP